MQNLATATTSFHAGSAGAFAMCVMIQPDRDLAVVIATNAGNDAALTAVQIAALQTLQP